MDFEVGSELRGQNLREISQGDVGTESKSRSIRFSSGCKRASRLPRRVQTRDLIAKINNHRSALDRGVDFLSS